MKIFKSKIGLELVIPITIIFGTILFLTITENPSWLGIAILLPVLFVVVHIFLSTEYIIDGELLKIKSSFLFNKTIEIKQIKKITETYTRLNEENLKVK